MRATSIEFRLRGVIIMGIIAAGFVCPRWDSTRAADEIAMLVHVPPRAVAVIGAVFVLAGAALRTWASAYLGSDVVMDRRIRSERIVADGPFRYVRNPLYLGLALFTIGFAVAASRFGAILMITGVVIFLLRLIGREEAALLVSQGERYRAFRDVVPRLVPALHPRLPASERTPNWRAAVFSESLFWALGFGLLAHALLDRWAAMVPLGLAAIVMRGVEESRARRQSGHTVLPR